jgi:hypothetical protein
VEWFAAKLMSCVAATSEDLRICPSCRIGHHS